MNSKMKITMIPLQLMFVCCGVMRPSQNMLARRLSCPSMCMSWRQGSVPPGYGPPIGAKYGMSATVTLIGTQNVAILVNDHKTVNLTMTGLVKHESVMEYHVDPKTKEVLFRIPDELQVYLDKYRVGLRDPTYDVFADNACITLLIPWLRLERRIKMSRQP